MNTILVFLGKSLAQSQQQDVINAIKSSSSAQTPPWVIWALFGVAAVGIGSVLVASTLR